METASPSLLQQKAELAAQVKTLVNADLRDVCREEKLQVSGVKSALQNRILGRLDAIVQRGDVHAFNKFRFTVQNPQNQYKTSASTSSPARSKSDATNTSASTKTNNIHSAHPAVNGYLGASAQHAMLSRQAPAYASRSPLTFKSSPFYQEKEVLSTLAIPVCQNHRNTVQMQLALPEHHADGLKRNSSIRVMLYCGENSHSHRSSATDISFPLNIEIKINDQEIRTNTKGVKGKPGSTRPVDITPFLRRHGATNIVSVTYALTTKAFVAVAMLVEKKSVEELQKIISQRRVITKDRVLANMQAKANDPDIIATSTVMSLKDPISYMRLSLPCRGTHCSHNQCFDASSFLQLQEQGPTWICPICNKSITFDTLAVDQYVQEILQSTPSSVDQITIEPNGAWSQGTANGQNGRGGSDGDDDSDDLVEITDFRISGLKAEPHTPTSLINRTLPVPSREATAASSASRGQKRRSEVVDLTLSDDDAPPPKRPSYGHNNQPSSLPDRPRNGYQLPNLSLHQSGSANNFSPFQIRRSFEAQLNQNTNSRQLGRSLQSPGPMSPSGSYQGGLNQQNQQEQEYQSYRYPQAYHQQDRPPSSSGYSNRSSLSMPRPPSYGSLQ